MPRTPAVCLLLVSALLTAGACSVGRPDRASSAAVPPGSPTAVQPPSAAAAPALTEAQARAALVTETDLGEPWIPTEGAATWRDGLLKARANRPECQRLLDTVYSEELFGTTTRSRAVTALDDAWDEAQLRYQVVTQRPADVDSTLAWLRTLPKKCASFTATTAQGAVRAGQVSGFELPEIGDAREALRLTLTGESADGEFTLTLDVAAVRVGDDALALTNGGVGDVSADVTQGIAQLGAERLAEIRRQGREQV
ncbi:hypothetical protein [Streptomyces sp. GESEQ-35]|uniref:hypothetical protein n=1 Tax=Streptomyces sp. GESEQ-35 TaxID=2812657 RepID=UPI001B324BD6|nr:hypothetical protein [Streptomyces sp. GESEQ-35]